METCWWPLSDQWSVHLTCRGLCGMELIGAISAMQINSGIVIIPNMRQIMLYNRFFHYIPYKMWNELCRTFYPWCHGVSARCLCFSFFFFCSPYQELLCWITVHIKRTVVSCIFIQMYYFSWPPELLRPILQLWSRLSGRRGSQLTWSVRSPCCCVVVAGSNWQAIWTLGTRWGLSWTVWTHSRCLDNAPEINR